MSILNVNKINPVGGGSTITIAGIASVTNNISVGNSVTAGSFVGPIEGAVTGNVTGNADTASGLSGNPSINTTGIVTATSFVPTVGQLSHRNLIINGDMRIAQRATTSTTAGVTTIDRFKFQYSGTDEAPTASQVDVTSGGAYDSGFRKCFKVTNGNQTGGAGTSDMISVDYHFETQDISYSGWNYVSSSSFITLSYWVKSSVSQNFYGRFQTIDGTGQNYPFETGTLTANTWTKITKTIPGNSNLQFDTSGATDLGFILELSMFRGTDKTGTIALDAWNPYGSGTTRTPDQTSTWYTTNDATFEITGVQFEVGPTATPFEHRSFSDELRRCRRYFYKSSRWMGGARGSSTSRSFILNFGMRLTGNAVSGGTYTNNATSGGDVVYIGSNATRQTSDVNANSLGASSTSTDNNLQIGVTVGYGIGSGDNGIVTGLYISGFTIDHEL
jgi:hypothetical protein